MDSLHHSRIACGKHVAVRQHGWCLRQAVGSARNNSRSMHNARMLYALHAACLYASTQAAYNNYHGHGMLSKIGTSFLHLTTLLVMGLSA